MRGRFDLLDPIHVAQQLLARSAHQGSTTNGLLCEPPESSAAPCGLAIHISISTLCSTRSAHLVQSQKTVKLEQAMEISEKNKGWDEFNLIRMAVEMRPEFDGLGEKKPEEEPREDGRWSRYQLIGRHT